MKKRYLTKKLKNRTLAITEALYRQSVAEVRETSSEEEVEFAISDLNTARQMVRFGYDTRATFDMSHEEIASLDKEISSLYLKKVLSLPTNILDDILFLHEKNAPRRASLTIASILNELTSRQLLDQNDDSDHKFKNEK